jgi:uncharacterized protein YbjT (DUF2867 family)
MNKTDLPILVFGATGQQGGSVAKALRSGGWNVRALVRNPSSDNAKALAAIGIELVRGDLEDGQSIQNAMAGVHGVFSVQPSSGQGAAYGVTDEDEIRYGKTIADIALENGVRHFVYSSTNAAGDSKTGMGHFDSKSEIEAHVRSLGMTHTIVRPSAFMEILMLPGMGLDKGEFTFFMRADQPMQFIAAEDIGKIVARIFAAPERFANRTIEIAGDAVTGTALASKFSAITGHSIAYHRFPDALLAQNRFLGTLARLVDDGRLSGNADLASLRESFPGLLTFDQWLEGQGRDALFAAINAESEGVSLR